MFASQKDRTLTEMVPELICAPDFFGPGEIWSRRNLVPRNLDTDKFWPRMKIIFRAQICREPNFMGTKKVRDPSEIGDHLS